MTKYDFANVRLHIPPGWLDVTESLPDGTPPTLGKSGEAVGALQFTTARFVRGERPRIDRHIIQSFLRDFEANHHLPQAPLLTDFQNTAAGTFGVFADYAQPEQFTRLWYVSDGQNMVFV